MPKYIPDCICGVGGLQSNCATVGMPPYKGACQVCGFNRTVYKRRIAMIRKKGLTMTTTVPYTRRLVLGKQA